MTFEQTPGGSGPGSPGDEADVGEVVTMVDVLKDGRDMEENAKVPKYQITDFATFAISILSQAVLGGASENVCSYNSGYISR